MSFYVECFAPPTNRGVNYYGSTVQYCVTSQQNSKANAPFFPTHNYGWRESCCDYTVEAALIKGSSEEGIVEVTGVRMRGGMAPNFA